jgi:hypothetical protein
MNKPVFGCSAGLYQSAEVLASAGFRQTIEYAYFSRVLTLNVESKETHLFWILVPMQPLIVVRIYGTPTDISHPLPCIKPPKQLL